MGKKAIQKGAILKRRAKEVGYTQERLAAECGISVSTLKRYMRGESLYSVELLEKFKICQILT